MSLPRSPKPDSSPDPERARIVTALVDVVTEHKEEQTTLAEVLERADVDEAAFHRHFSDFEDCYYQTVNEMNDEFIQRAAGAFASEEGWQDQIRATGFAILEFILENPKRASFIFVGTLSFGERTQLLRDQTISMFTGLLDSGRKELDDPESVSMATAEGVAGAVYHQLYIQIAHGGLDDPQAFTDLFRQLMYTAMLPYVGPEAAMEELRRPWPQPPTSPAGDTGESGGDGAELGPLPSGRHGISREQVAHSQRERLIAGLVDVVVEHGYNDATIADITKAASVSRRVFYENFESKEECFLTAFDIIVEGLREKMLEASEGIEYWPDRVVVQLRALLRYYATDPKLGQLGLIDPFTAGPVVAERYRAAVNSFAAMIEPGRELHKSPRPLPKLFEESVLGGLVSLVARSIAEGNAEHLEDLFPDLAEFILTPYIGPEETARIIRENS